MSTFEPGDRIIVRGEVVELCPNGDALVEFFSKTDQWRGWIRPDLCTTGVVLDLDDPKRLYADLCAAIEACGNGAVAARLTTFAGEIRELVKPPRIPEPGLWGVVEARLSGDEKRARLNYIRTEPFVWTCVGGARRTWPELLEPTLVRPGIEDES